MSVKYTAETSKTRRDFNPFRLSNKYASAKRPIKIPLVFNNLKSKTKYKVFLQNDDATRFEDITKFCVPYGPSILDNNNVRFFDEFVSNDNGEIYIQVKPYGTDNVSLDQSDWDKHWRYITTKTGAVDVGRKNFVIVESSRVAGATTDEKVKIFTGRSYPASLSDETEPKTRSRKIKQQIPFDFIQTFYVDPNKVDNSTTVDITDVTLYFRNQPFRLNNNSNRREPGVTVALVDVEDGVPVAEKQYEDSVVSQAWSFITPSSDASVPTIFSFNSPITLEAGRFYGICVMFDDRDYILWQSRRGFVLVNSEEISPGPDIEHRGALYERTNAQSTLADSSFDAIFTEREDSDLKFDIHVAEYDLEKAANSDIELVNINQEFLVISNTTNGWFATEAVYKDVANTENNVSIDAGDTYATGISTTFTSTVSRGTRVVLDDGTNKQVVNISRVISNTEIQISEPSRFTMSSAGLKVTPVAEVDHYDLNSGILFLKNSSATSSFFFDDGDTIIGVESDESATIDQVASFPLSLFSTNFDLTLPNDYSVTGTYQLSEVSGNTITINPNGSDVNFFRPNYVEGYDGVISSRSLEAKNESTLFDQDGDANTSDAKSLKLKLDFEYDGTEKFLYRSPIIDINHLSLATRQWRINNDATNEHTDNGNALSKHISKRLTLSEGQEAEDIRLIQNAYRPLGTDIKVYAKIINTEDPDPFDDKNWTELTRISGENQFSEKDNVSDYREYEYSFPTEIPTANTLDGTVTLSNTAVVTGVGTTFTSDLSSGDVIKIYSPFFEDNYGFFSIVSVDSDTQLTLNEPTTDIDLTGTGFKIDTTETPHTAYLNPLNLNVVRYFGQNGESYDGYSSVAIKTVLLSEDSRLTPRVDDNRVVSVSA